MTTREKVLVYMLMVVCIVGGGYRFLIDPMIDKVNTNTQARYELYEERQIIDKQISQLAELEELYIQNTQSLEELQEVLGPYLTDEELEVYLRTMGDDFDIGIQSLTITNDENEYVDITTTEIVSKSMSMTVYGGIQDFLEFIKHMNEQEKMILLSLSIGISEGIEEDYLEANGVYSEANFYVTFVQFMETEFPMEIEDELEDEAEDSEVEDSEAEDTNGDE